MFFAIQTPENPSSNESSHPSNATPLQTARHGCRVMVAFPLAVVLAAVQILAQGDHGSSAEMQADEIDHGSQAFLGLEIGKHKRLLWAHFSGVPLHHA